MATVTTGRVRSPKSRFTPGVERLAHAEAGLHDPFAVDLGEVVVGEQEVDLAREVALELGGLVEHLPAVFGAAWRR